jgi:AraC-like DNA-binding protein
VGLPYYGLDNVEDYVPSYLFWAFVSNAWRHEGIEDFGFRVGQMFGANSVDPKLENLLRQSPTLYHGLVKFINMSNKTVTTSRMALLRRPQGEQIYFVHRPSCNAQDPAIAQIGWYGLMTTMGVIREFAGPEWYPTEIGVMTHRDPCMSILESFPGTLIRLSQRCSYIALDNALLSLPPLTSAPVDSASSSLHLLPYASGFPDSLTQVLASYAQEKKLSIELAAGLCNMSKRTLQRRLRESSTSYSALLDQARFQVAIRMLKDCSIKVTDIARQLGYSDTSHFGRAFRRVAGVSPRVYRRVLQQRMN